MVFFFGVEASTEENPIVIFWGKTLRRNYKLEFSKNKVYLP
jgi:hypothetical protein